MTSVAFAALEASGHGFQYKDRMTVQKSTELANIVQSMMIDGQAGVEVSSQGFDQFPDSYASFLALLRDHLNKLIKARVEYESVISSDEWMILLTPQVLANTQTKEPDMLKAGRQRLDNYSNAVNGYYRDFPADLQALGLDNAFLKPAHQGFEKSLTETYPLQKEFLNSQYQLFDLVGKIYSLCAESYTAFDSNDGTIMFADSAAVIQYNNLIDQLQALAQTEQQIQIDMMSQHNNSLKNFREHRIKHNY